MAIIRVHKFDDGDYRMVAHCKGKVKFVHFHQFSAWKAGKALSDRANEKVKYVKPDYFRDKPEFWTEVEQLSERPTTRKAKVVDRRGPVETRQAKSSPKQGEKQAARNARRRTPTPVVEI